MYLKITTSHECRPKKMLYINVRQWADKSQEAQWTDVVQNQSSKGTLVQANNVGIYYEERGVQRPITREDNALHSSIQLYLQWLQLRN